MYKEGAGLIQIIRDGINARRLRRALQQDPDSAMEASMSTAWVSDQSVRVDLDGDGNPIEVQVGSVTVGRRSRNTTRR